MNDCVNITFFPGLNSVQRFLVKLVCGMFAFCRHLFIELHKIVRINPYIIILEYYEQKLENDNKEITELYKQKLMLYSLNRKMKVQISLLQRKNITLQRKLYTANNMIRILNQTREHKEKRSKPLLNINEIDRLFKEKAKCQKLKNFENKSTQINSNLTKKSIIPQEVLKKNVTLTNIMKSEPKNEKNIQEGRNKSNNKPYMQLSASNKIAVNNKILASKRQPITNKYPNKIQMKKIEKTKTMLRKSFDSKVVLKKEDRIFTQKSTSNITEKKEIRKVRLPLKHMNASSNQKLMNKTYMIH